MTACIWPRGTRSEPVLTGRGTWVLMEGLSSHHHKCWERFSFNSRVLVWKSPPLFQRHTLAAEAKHDLLPLIATKIIQSTKLHKHLALPSDTTQGAMQAIVSFSLQPPYKKLFQTSFSSLVSWSLSAGFCHLLCVLDVALNCRASVSVNRCICTKLTVHYY